MTESELGGVRVMSVTRRIELLLNGLVAGDIFGRVVHPVAVVVAGGIDHL